MHLCVAVDVKCLLNETCTWCHEWDQDNRWLNGILSNSCNREFDFAKPEEWPRWSKRFEQFRQASDFASKTEEVQISTLVYSWETRRKISFSRLT